MDIKELQTTDMWDLYQKSVNFMHLRKIYEDTDLNYRMYNGDQWNGLKVKGIEKVQFNFIKLIVKQKVSNITANLFAINYSPENIENQEFVDMAQKTCDLLNRKASTVFDKDFMDKKVKKWTRQAAINDEAICYVDYDSDTDLPINEIISKNDIMYGNENEDEIQFQPYILIRQRKPVSELRELARDLELDEEKVGSIVGDNDTSTASGDSAKDELEDKCWLLTMFYRAKDGNIHWSQSTKYCELKKDKDLGIRLYPIAHFNWEDQEGNARGVGEVRQLIPNQIETNKTAMRRAETVKSTAYPQKVMDVTSVENPEEANRIGGVIKFRNMGGAKADDVFTNTRPAQMSPDSSALQGELINLTRELNNANDAATGSIDPSTASGKAILAVQNAQNLPLNDQVMGLKSFLEDIARIWFAMWKTYAGDGLKVDIVERDITTGQELRRQEKVPKTVIEALETSVKVDITPKGAFDKYAQELSLENLFTSGNITFEEYVNSLDTDSVMPKVKLQQIVKDRQEAQARIQAINMEAEAIKGQLQAQNANEMDIENQMANQRITASTFDGIEQAFDRVSPA